MTLCRWFTVAFAGTLLAGRLASAESNLDKKLAPRIADAVQWAANPEIVAAVKARNRALAPEYAPLTELAWEALKPTDPLVVGLMTNPAGKFLRSKRSAAVVEAFLNDAAGRKVAFIAKSTSWQHQRSPKHQEPMAGKTWKGSVAFDESSGTKAVPIAVPVLDEGKPIGSLIVGISIFEIAREQILPAP